RSRGSGRAALRRRFGRGDRCPLSCGRFSQWRRDAAFAGGRPRLGDAGVRIVSDVEPYELMKLGLLNASHQALCYPGYLAGYRLVHEVTTGPVSAKSLLTYMTDEAIPPLGPVPGTALRRYARQLIERFSNPEVRDTVARLCANTSDLIPKFLFPVIRHQLAAGGPVTRSAAVVASWARYAEGTDENGERDEIDGVLAPQLRGAAGPQRGHPAAFLEDNRAVFGDLADDTRFTRAYSSILTALLDGGVRKTFADLDHYAPERKPPD